MRAIERIENLGNNASCEYIETRQKYASQSKYEIHKQYASCEHIEIQQKYTSQSKYEIHKQYAS